MPFVGAGAIEFSFENLLAQDSFGVRVLGGRKERIERHVQVFQPARHAGLGRMAGALRAEVVSAPGTQVNRFTFGIGRDALFQRPVAENLHGRGVERGEGTARATASAMREAIAARSGSARTRA